MHDLMDDVAEQQEIANEISEAISSPVGFGQDVDEVGVSMKHGYGIYNCIGSCLYLAYLFCVICACLTYHLVCLISTPGCLVYHRFHLV